MSNNSSASSFNTVPALPVAVPKTRIVISKHTSSYGVDYSCGRVPFTLDGTTFQPVGGGGNMAAFCWDETNSAFNQAIGAGWFELIIVMDPATDTIKQVYVYKTAKSGKNAGKEVRQYFDIRNYELVIEQA